MVPLQANERSISRHPKGFFQLEGWIIRNVRTDPDDHDVYTDEQEVNQLQVTQRSAEDGVRCDDERDSTGQRNRQHMSAKGSGEEKGSLLRWIGLQDVRCITGEKCMNNRVLESDVVCGYGRHLAGDRPRSLSVAV